MSDGPPIARIAALIGDPTRAEVLGALLAGRALTATELSDVAGVGKATMSAHLSQLVDAGLLAVAVQGRHRYFRLAGADVAQLLESLMGVAVRAGVTRLRTGPREPALRRARRCYDHLAGELAVWACDTLQARDALRLEDEQLRLGADGARWFAQLGIDVDAVGSRGASAAAAAAAGAGPGAGASLRGAGTRRPLCRACLDWGERRYHLAGVLGAAMADRIEALGWARREGGSRAVTFSATGERAFRRIVEEG